MGVAGSSTLSSGAAGATRGTLTSGAAGATRGTLSSGAVGIGAGAGGAVARFSIWAIRMYAFEMLEP